MKKVYMTPEWEMQNMMVEQLICLSGNSSTSAEPDEDVLINERPDFGEDIEHILNPLGDFDMFLK